MRCYIRSSRGVLPTIAYAYISYNMYIRNDIFRVCVRVRVYTVFNNNHLHAEAIIIYSPAAAGTHIITVIGAGVLRPGHWIGKAVCPEGGGVPIAIFNRRETSQNTNLLCGGHKSCK